MLVLKVLLLSKLLLFGLDTNSDHVRNAIDRHIRFFAHDIFLALTRRPEHCGSVPPSRLEAEALLEEYGCDRAVWVHIRSEKADKIAVRLVMFDTKGRVVQNHTLPMMNSIDLARFLVETERKIVNEERVRNWPALANVPKSARLDRARKSRSAYRQAV